MIPFSRARALTRGLGVAAFAIFSLTALTDAATAREGGGVGDGVHEAGVQGASAAQAARATDASRVSEPASSSIPMGQEAAVRAPKASGAVQIPRVLKAADRERYARIFALQENGHWKAADALIAELSDPLLMGHVLAQRYLHPNKYRSKYKELKAWMTDHADHPQAGRIYKLALKRRPRNWRHPERPDALPNFPRFTEEAEEDEPRAVRLPKKRLSRDDRKRARALTRQIKRAVRRGHTLAAKRHVQSADFTRLFSAAEQDALIARLAFKYFLDGRVTWAYDWASKAAKRSGELVADTHWAAGLAAWKLGKTETAAEHFQASADVGFTDPWLDAAANFWAARSLMVARAPKRVNHYLRKAADHARTFHGLLAAHVLGVPIDYDWSSPPIVADGIKRVLAEPRGKRAMALAEVGQDRQAERELRNLARLSDRAQAQNILALADLGGLAGLAVRLSDSLFPDGGGYDGAAYPIPAFLPDGGFTVDRALVYALMRQESRFNPKAKSWAGARGLMQLMPGTARYVARATRVALKDRRQLYKPGVNMTLGQNYIQILLEEDHIEGDLMLLAAAWNGGPGNLSRWQRRVDYASDPLLFIESIPSYETRHFVERVLANLWIYRDRLGQAKPSLEALAAGRWPLYVSLGQGQTKVAFAR